MKSRLRLLTAVLALCLPVPGLAGSPTLDVGAMVQHTPLTARFADPGYFVWDGAPVKGDDGKYHLYYSRWPIKEGFLAWATHSVIAHAVSDHPFGPYIFQDVALPERGAEYWDGHCTQQPNLIACGGRYYMFYMGNRGDRVKVKGLNYSHRNNQRIGLAVADRLEGPWRRFDQPIIDASSDKTAFDSLCVTNPAATMRPDGGVIVLYKAVQYIEGKIRGGNVRYGAAVADSPAGPYRKVPGRIFEADDPGAQKHWMLAEDPYVWFSERYGRRYYAITRDVVGQFTGATGGLALFQSPDGLNWSSASQPRVLGARFQWADGTWHERQVERPALLFEGEEPVALFGAIDGYHREGKISSNVHIPLRVAGGTPGIVGPPSAAAAIPVPRIVGAWSHVYKPAPDVFPGPDSPRFKTGQKYPNWQVNDHAILKGPDGRWHAFGISHPAVEAGEPNAHEAEWLLFHAAAPTGTLKQQSAAGRWQDQPKVLPPAKRPGEIREIHSPSVVHHAGQYWMFYGYSPIRYAVSKDLWSWEPRGELFRQEGSARDPSVLRHDGVFYMCYTTRQSILVRTSRDLLRWSEPSTVFSLAPGETGGPESPTLLALHGGFYLIWCRWDAELSKRLVTYQDRSFVYFSTDPLNFRERAPVAEIQGHAPEFFQDEDGDWWISSAERPYRGVSIAPIKWEPHPAPANHSAPSAAAIPKS